MKSISLQYSVQLQVLSARRFKLTAAKKRRKKLDIKYAAAGQTSFLSH
jgi:hypothetical protein